MIATSTPAISTPVTQSPVLSSDEALRVGQKILAMTSSEVASIGLTHSARRIVRVSRNRMRPGDSGDDIDLVITAQIGVRPAVSVRINQLDDASLRAAVRYVESIARQQPGTDRSLTDTRVPYGPQHYRSVSLWHDSTAAAVNDGYAATIPPAIHAIAGAGLTGSMFVGAAARTTVVLDKSGLVAHASETDTECTVTAWNSNGTGSGWAGDASRDWATLDVSAITQRAIDITRRSANPAAVEPGRYTTVLAPPAVAQIVRAMMGAFDAQRSDSGLTPLSKAVNGGNKLGMRVFDARVNLWSDPADAEGGFMPFDRTGLPWTPMSWVEQGVLKNLSYDPPYAARKGKRPYSWIPTSVHLGGGPTPIDEMIARCELGIYVNRFSNITVLDGTTGVMSGVTRDGCFLIKHGKLDTPVKNLRFIDSPFFFLNRLEAIGPSTRQGLGYTPDRTQSWPLGPMIVPPLMVSDFNFAALGDAV